MLTRMHSAHQAVLSTFSSSQMLPVMGDALLAVRFDFMKSRAGSIVVTRKISLMSAATHQLI